LKAAGTVLCVTEDAEPEDPTNQPRRLPRWRVLLADRRLRRWLRRGLVATAVAGVLAVALVVGCVAWVDRGARGHLYTAASVPVAPVALVLGAQTIGDTPSPFLAARLALAKQLLETGKVRVLLVSGDNSRPDYDEPDAMRSWLIRRGVPARLVVADYAGFDTYDSCARAHLIFGVDRAIVVTQTYHLARAVSLCRHLGIDADGVGDDTVRHDWYQWWKATVREQGACVKAGYDLAIRRSPVFLGRHETGVQDALRGR
jgi:vancomycin permeability regulator SanA